MRMRRYAPTSLGTRPPEEVRVAHTLRESGTEFSLPSRAVTLSRLFFSAALLPLCVETGSPGKRSVQARVDHFVSFDVSALVRSANRIGPPPRHHSLPTSYLCNYRIPGPPKTTTLAMSYTGFWDEIRKIPPVTRFLCGSSLAVSLPVMLQLLSPYKVIFVRALVTQRFEVRSSISKRVHLTVFSTVR